MHGGLRFFRQVPGGYRRGLATLAYLYYWPPTELYGLTVSRYLEWMQLAEDTVKEINRARNGR